MRQPALPLLRARLAGPVKTCAPLSRSQPAACEGRVEPGWRGYCDPRSALESRRCILLSAVVLPVRVFARRMKQVCRGANEKAVRVVLARAERRGANGDVIDGPLSFGRRRSRPDRRYHCHCVCTAVTATTATTATTTTISTTGRPTCTTVCKRKRSPSRARWVGFAHPHPRAPFIDIPLNTWNHSLPLLGSALLDDVSICLIRPVPWLSKCWCLPSGSGHARVLARDTPAAPLLSSYTLFLVDGSTGCG